MQSNPKFARNWQNVSPEPTVVDVLVIYDVTTALSGDDSLVPHSKPTNYRNYNDVIVILCQYKYSVMGGADCRRHILRVFRRFRATREQRKSIVRILMVTEDVRQICLTRNK